MKHRQSASLATVEEGVLVLEDQMAAGMGADEGDGDMFANGHFALSQAKKRTTPRYDLRNELVMSTDSDWNCFAGRSA